METVEVSVGAGLIVHPIKFCLEPTHRLIFLGFWLDSEKMTVKLTVEKAQKIKKKCNIS